MERVVKLALSNWTIGRESNWLLYKMFMVLHKDLSVGKSWDIQYNRGCHMALALAQKQDLFWSVSGYPKGRKWGLPS